ncbi:hypothetical protein ACIQUQ_30310 [Streptomyces sp. NPDC101118]|uniref:hypothetical protein n=1 Tax=Streptomyces sp. NPDC101118 TaxID=3366109 RepID=UPI003816DBC7
MTGELNLNIRGATPEWFAELASLLADPRARTALRHPAPDPDLVHSAVRLLQGVKTNGRDLLRLALEGNGRADGPTYRERHGEGSLNGATTTLTRTIKAGIREQWWPADLPRLLLPTGPEKEGWSKTAAYHLTDPDRLLPVLREAFAQYDNGRGRAGRPAPAGHASTALARLTALYEEAGHRPDHALAFATDLLAQHANEHATMLRAHGHHQAADLLGAGE